MALSRRSFLRRSFGAAGALAVGATVTAPVVAPVVPVPNAAPVAAQSGYERFMTSPSPQEIQDAHTQIMREAAIANPALLLSLVQHSLVSRESAMQMMGITAE